MGKRLNALLGRSSKSSKLKMLANLAVSRIAILTNFHRVRCSQARSDVIQLLHRGHQQRALLRVELVMKEQNTLDALAMMESYCHILVERSELITDRKEWDCPAELKEAACTLIFAASRTGEFPELHEIRRMLTSRYGRDFANSAVELRDDSAVYPKMVQRLSTERASMESRENLVMQIAKDNGIGHEVLHISNLQMHEEEDEKLDDLHEVREQLSESVEARAGVELRRNEQWDESHHQYFSPISETQMRDSEEGESLSLGLNLK